MCGIWTYIKNNNNEIKNLEQLFNDFMKTKHRGPTFSNFQNYNNILIGFHRLSIMDLSFKSNQPYVFCRNNRTIVFICNGEIYNYKQLNELYQLNIKSKSDCMTIPELYLSLEYNDFIKLFTKDIKGEFAFLLFEFDTQNKIKYVVAGRDMVGVRPLYYSDPFKNKDKDIIFSSEIKSCSSYDGIVSEFPPGEIHKYHFVNDKLTLDIDKYNYSDIDKYNYSDIYSVVSKINEHSNIDQRTINLYQQYLLNDVYDGVYDSINRRLESDQPLAFLLSGGVDSSLVAGIASKILNRPIKTFCCGMNYGSDLKYAKMVADHIGSEHTEVLFTPEEALDAINDVIYTTETWDTTTIRASVGQYLVSKYISQNTDAKVIFVGEGADEVCSSYLFNWYAPTSNLIHETAIEYVKEMHQFDIKRSDRCIARWGLEARVSLLDPEFIKSYWSIPSKYRDPKYKGIEKWWLRKAFEQTNILPSEVLWRKKEAFSDGISSTEKSWFQIIQEYIREKYDMDEKEYYKMKFIEFFGENRLNIIDHYWQPKWNKDGSNVESYVDPSARTLDIYSK
jgi:asparagine synthase (glutamine-hydrolysing)